MIIKDFIEELRQKEIEISFSEGKLKYSGPEENITPELIENLKTNKGKLIKYFWPEDLALMMPINTAGLKTPLFIVHGDYANYAISKHLGSDQPVYGFFHHGSEGEAITFKHVEEMAKTYLDKVLAVYPSGPFYLMGFSFGGTLAFEMAVQLQKSGYDVPVLILLDSMSPLAKEPVRLHRNIIKLIRKNLLGPLSRKLKKIGKMTLSNLYILVKKPVPVNKRSDYIALKYLSLTRKYSPAKFKGNILLFRTLGNSSSFKYLGWESLADSIRLIEVKGSHLEIFSDKDNTAMVQREIESCLMSANGLK